MRSTYSVWLRLPDYMTMVETWLMKGSTYDTVKLSTESVPVVDSRVETGGYRNNWALFPTVSSGWPVGTREWKVEGGQRHRDHDCSLVERCVLKRENHWGTKVHITLFLY